MRDVDSQDDGVGADQPPMSLQHEYPENDELFEGDPSLLLAEDLLLPDDTQEVFDAFVDETHNGYEPGTDIHTDEIHLPCTEIPSTTRTTTDASDPNMIDTTSDVTP